MVSLDFGEALALLKEGKCVRRADWSGRCLCMFNPLPDIGVSGAMRIMMVTHDGYECSSSQWYPEQADLITEDWVPMELGLDTKAGGK